MADVKFAFVVLFQLGTGGDQAKLAGPSHRQAIRGKLRIAAQMWVPALSCADEQHAVSRIFNDIAAIMKMQGELLIAGRGLRQHDVQKVVATRAALLQAHPLILKKGQGTTLIVRKFIHNQGAGELQAQDALRSYFGAQAHRGGGLKGVVGENRSFNGVQQPAEGGRRDWRVRQPVGSPNIIKSMVARFVDLTENKLLLTPRIEHQIKGSGRQASDPGIEIRRWSKREPREEDAQGDTGVQLGHRGLPLREEGSIHLGRKMGGAELAEQFVGRVVSETEIGVQEVFVEDRCAEETAHLLLFDRIARNGESMAVPGENRARYFAVEGGEEREGAFLKGENG